MDVSGRGGFRRSLLAMRRPEGCVGCIVHTVLKPASHPPRQPQMRRGRFKGSRKSALPEEGTRPRYRLKHHSSLVLPADYFFASAGYTYSLWRQPVVIVQPLALNAAGLWILGEGVTWMLLGADGNGSMAKAHGVREQSKEASRRTAVYATSTYRQVATRVICLAPER